MLWKKSWRTDPVARVLADRHYNRQKPGSKGFVPPGRCAVFLKQENDALWVTSWPFAEYVKHVWKGAWVNSLFRNESQTLSSELIVQALAATRWFYQQTPSWNKDPEPAGMVTFIDSGKVKSKNPGFCYLQAGFERCGFTKAGLHAAWIPIERMPIAEAFHAS